MKRIFALLLVFLTFGSLGEAEASTNKILAIIAGKDFRDEELFIPEKIFKENGFKLVVASSSLSPSRGMLGAEVRPDILLEAVNVDDYDAIIFIGGIGASEYWNNPIAHKLTQDADKKNKVLAAICFAPVTLANAGVLSKKKATVWASEANKIIQMGAVYTGSAVEVDGNIITANSPSASPQFAWAIVDKLK